jgi:hypothetical protein
LTVSPRGASDAIRSFEAVGLDADIWVTPSPTDPSRAILTHPPAPRNRAVAAGSRNVAENALPQARSRTPTVVN